MKLRDCILDCPMTGICTIDVDKVCKLFPRRKKTFISYYQGSTCGSEYRLVNYKAGIKIDISNADAKSIISRLNLVEYKNPVFIKASTFALESR